MESSQLRMIVKKTVGKSQKMERRQNGFQYRTSEIMKLNWTIFYCNITKTPRDFKAKNIRNELNIWLNLADGDKSTPGKYFSKSTAWSIWIAWLFSVLFPIQNFDFYQLRVISWLSYRKDNNKAMCLGCH